MTEQAPEPPDSPSSPASRDPAVLAVAVAALVGLAALIMYLLRNLAMPPEQWTRAILLLNGIEAVAFAAAGYVFASQVGRAQVAAAEEKAAQVARRAEARISAAEVKAAQEARDAENGRRLADEIRAQFSIKNQIDPPIPEDHLKHLHATASVLFPERFTK